MSGGNGTQLGPFGAVQLGTVGGAVDLDFSRGNFFQLTSSASIVATPKSMKKGGYYFLEYISGGAFTLAFANCSIRAQATVGVPQVATARAYFLMICLDVASDGQPTLALLPVGSSAFVEALLTSSLTVEGIAIIEELEVNEGLIAYGGVTVQEGLSVNSGTVNLNPDGGIGVFGAAPVTKRTVTGSRGGNAALASLLTALATYGIITDSSTA